MEGSDLIYYILIYALNMSEIGAFPLFWKNKEIKEGKMCPSSHFSFSHSCRSQPVISQAVFLSDSSLW